MSSNIDTDINAHIWKKLESTFYFTKKKKKKKKTNGYLGCNFFHIQFGDNTRQ